MTDPIAGNFTGLHARVSFAGSDDYAVTTGGFEIENIYDNPWPSGDASEHNIWVGRKLNSLSIERQMIDATFFQALMTASPTTGTVQTVVTAGASLNTVGNLTLSGTPPVNSGNGLLKLTTAGATTSNTSPVLMPIMGYDLNGNVIQDYFTMPALAPAATIIYSTKPFATTQYINNPVALGTSVTCTVASIAGATTFGFTETPGTITIVMKLTHPVTNNKVWATFTNCMQKKDPIDWKSGKTVSNKLEYVVANPNTDITFVTA